MASRYLPTNHSWQGGACKINDAHFGNVKRVRGGGGALRYGAAGPDVKDGGPEKHLRAEKEEKNVLRYDCFAFYILLLQPLKAQTIIVHLSCQRLKKNLAVTN